MGQNIGVFDSGLGGLSVYWEIRKLLPNRRIIYFADHKNAPYGTKTQKEIKKLTTKSIQFLVERGCNQVVIACNTATTGGIDFYRRKFPNISFVGVVPPIKPAAIVSKSKKIVILSTTATSKSKYLRGLIKEFASGCKVWNLGCPELVEAVESGDIDGEKTKSVLKKYLAKPLKEGADVVVLGCTHFPFLEDPIKKFASKEVIIMNPSSPVAGQVVRQYKNTVPKDNENVVSEDEFYTSGDVTGATKIAAKLLGRKVEFKTCC